LQNYYDDVNSGKIPLSDSDKTQLLSYISDMTKAYQRSAGDAVVDGNPHNLTPTDIQTAQTKWDTEANNPDGGKQDPDFTTVTSSTTAMSKFFSAQNTSLGTTQQMWTQMNTSWQGADNSQQQMIQKLEDNMVKAQKSG
jgi:hypothetical protein